MKLQPRLVEKPWGRTHLPSPFVADAGTRIGEIWFRTDDSLPLLVKYLFTSEKLSVQVHPDDRQAKCRGHVRGKGECWYILDADPGASIGLGLRHEVSADELRSAALDGSIEQLMRWWPISKGDFVYVEPGTIHAIGGGISLLEVQENSDVTYRLFDYGRPRELHLDEAIDVANRGPFPERLFRTVKPAEEGMLVAGPIFDLEHSHSDTMQDRVRWVIPLDGSVSFGDEVAKAGDCLLLSPGDRIETDGARLLVAAITGG